MATHRLRLVAAAPLRTGAVLVALVGLVWLMLAGCSPIPHPAPEPTAAPVARVAEAPVAPPALERFEERLRQGFDPTPALPVRVEGADPDPAADGSVEGERFPPRSTVADTAPEQAAAPSAIPVRARQVEAHEARLERTLGGLPARLIPLVNQPLIARSEPDQPSLPPPPAGQTAPSPTPNRATRPAPNDPRSVVVPALMYHYVRVNPDPRDVLGLSLSVAPAEFEQQMAALAREGYSVVDLADVDAALRGERSLPPRPVALTFDDGYRDFYDAALPVLRRYRFPATVFVVTGFVDRPAYLTWPMVQEIQRSGLARVGSHTLDHADLTALSRARVQAQLADSRRILEEAVGGPVPYFCYPGGKLNAAVAGAVEAAGYQLAFTTQYGSRWRWAERFTLPRVRVDGREGLATFVRKVRNAAEAQ